MVLVMRLIEGPNDFLPVQASVSGLLPLGGSVSRLDRFYAEVTERGGEACLPRNLTDEWLTVVAQAIEALAFDPDSDHDVEPAEELSEDVNAIGLAAVLSILSAKRGNPPSLNVRVADLQEYFSAYRMELALEQVHRCTDVKYEPATIENIFTHREVRTWKDS